MSICPHCKQEVETKAVASDIVIRGKKMVVKKSRRVYPMKYRLQRMGVLYVDVVRVK